MAASLVSKRPGKCCRPEGAASAAPKTYRPPTTQDPTARGPRSPLPPPHRQAEGVGPAASMGTSLPTGGGSGGGRCHPNRGPQETVGGAGARAGRRDATREQRAPAALLSHRPDAGQCGPRPAPRTRASAPAQGCGRRRGGARAAGRSELLPPMASERKPAPRTPGGGAGHGGRTPGVARATAGGPRGWRGPRQARLRPTAGRVCSVTSKEDADSRKTKGLSYCGAEVTCWPRSPLNEAARDSIGDSSYMSL